MKPTVYVYFISEILIDYSIVESLGSQKLIWFSYIYSVCPFGFLMEGDKTCTWGLRLSVYFTYFVCV